MSAATFVQMLPAAKHHQQEKGPHPQPLRQEEKAISVRHNAWGASHGPHRVEFFRVWHLKCLVKRLVKDLFCIVVRTTKPTKHPKHFLLEHKVQVTSHLSRCGKKGTPWVHAALCTRPLCKNSLYFTICENKGSSSIMNSTASRTSKSNALQTARGLR